MMFKILKAYGIPPRRLNAIKAMYTGTRAKVVTEDGDSDEFEITAGVLQGDTLAPFLFVITLTTLYAKPLTERRLTWDSHFLRVSPAGIRPRR